MLLAIDTSTRYSGIALYDGEQTLLEYTWRSAHFHTRHLAPAVERALALTGISAADVQAVAAALGPGSFTGLRIGLAFAKGLALARRIPLVGVPTLDFLAAARPASDLPLAAVLLAGRGRYSVQEYRWREERWQPDGGLAVYKLPELSARLQRPVLVCGELDAAARRALAAEAPQARLCSPAEALRRPAFLAELAWARWQRGETDDPVSLAPVYLHYS